MIKAIHKLINALEGYHDTNTQIHENHTGHLMGILAKQAGLDETLCETLTQAGKLHDIGKLTIPPKIIEKPGPLTRTERKIIELHVTSGYELIKKIQHNNNQLLSNIILYHHENMDGSGYPQQIKGDNIPIEAQICSICDVYDALRSPRPYRFNLTHDEVAAFMQSTDTKGMAYKFNPDLLITFFNAKNEYLPLYSNHQSKGSIDKIDPTYR